MARKPDTPCAGCGKLLYGGRGSLPAGKRKCRACREVGPRAVPLANCTVCGSTLSAPRSPGGYRRTTCSNACAGRRRNATPRVPGGGSCGCGAAVVGAQVFCGACRVTRERARNRLKCSLRRAKRRGMRVGRPARVMSIQELGQRDGWRCHLCRRKVRAALRVPSPGAPTFDHLIPISDGGDDQPTNLRLAHFRCNSARGNRGVVQLLLVG